MIYLDAKGDVKMKEQAIRALLLALPAAAAFWVGWQFGLLASCAVILPESLICFLRGRLFPRPEADRQDIGMIALSTAGILLGAAVYRPAPDPVGVGIAAALLAAVVHAAAILIISTLIARRAK